MGPQILMVRLTENCNAGCFMCNFARLKNAKFVTSEEISEIIAKIKGKGFRMVRFTGGETLLHKGINEIIKAFADEGLRTSIITNGYFLPRRYQALLDSGLNQVVVSLDGSNAELHDRLRDTPKLFNNLVTGLKLIREAKPETNLRINTVVSPHNVDDLSRIADLLVELDIDQWSIIPLKGEADVWHESNRELFLRSYSEFQERVKDLPRPALLGYSKNWAGRDEGEVDNFINETRPFTPRGECNLVDQVRYYVPSTQRLSPCNCASYRTSQLGINGETGGFNLESANESAVWLKENGPKNCTGCEPVNAYLGEHPEILAEDIFAW